MIKKITIAIILCFIIISCGKKGDPIYKKYPEIERLNVPLRMEYLYYGDVRNK